MAISDIPVPICWHIHWWSYPTTVCWRPSVSVLEEYHIPRALSLITSENLILRRFSDKISLFELSVFLESRHYIRLEGFGKIFKRIKTDSNWSSRIIIFSLAWCINSENLHIPRKIKKVNSLSASVFLEQIYRWAVVDFLTRYLSKHSLIKDISVMKIYIILEIHIKLTSYLHEAYWKISFNSLSR